MWSIWSIFLFLNSLHRGPTAHKIALRGAVLVNMAETLMDSASTDIDGSSSDGTPSPVRRVRRRTGEGEAVGGGVIVVDASLVFIAESPPPVVAEETQEAPAEPEPERAVVVEPFSEEVVPTVPVCFAASHCMFVHRLREWWVGPRGVINVHRFGLTTAVSAGKVLEQCRYAIGRVIGEAGGSGSVRFKIGMTSNLFLRWSFYEEDDEPFTHMFFLHQTSSREGANMLEAALIAAHFNVEGCINTERRDLGGTGRGVDGPCYVYVVAHRVRS